MVWDVYIHYCIMMLAWLAWHKYISSELESVVIGMFPGADGIQWWLQRGHVTYGTLQVT